LCLTCLQGNCLVGFAAQSPIRGKVHQHGDITLLQIGKFLG
jgi:hypothetical protein